MSDTALYEPIDQASRALVEALRQHAEPLPPPEHADAFGAFFDRFGDARMCGWVRRRMDAMIAHAADGFLQHLEASHARQSA